MTPDPLFTAIEAAAATGGDLCGVAGSEGMSEWEGRGVSFDTRTLAAGDIFVALEGARDGHEFLSAAAKAGASAAIVSRIDSDMPTSLPLLKVDGSTMTALEDLAVAARNRHFGKLVAVTGSVGKTSTKEMLRAALSTCGKVHAAERSFNNHIGVPVSLATMPMSSRFGVFEIGMNHAGEITPLTRLVRPHVAIITTIGPAHLENLGSVDAIAAAKAEILLGLRPRGVAVLPADSPYYDFLCAEARNIADTKVLPFGESAAADDGVRLLDYIAEGDRAVVQARIMGRDVRFPFVAAGRHQAVNAMAVIAAATALGLPIETVLEGLSAFEAGAGRGLREELTISEARITVLDESYNANPASMEAAFAVLGSIAPGGNGRRLAVLGEMRELGADADALHASLAEPLLAAGTERLFLSGPLMKSLAEVIDGRIPVDYAEKAEDLRGLLSAELQTGDVVLFKGSNASGISAMLNAIRADAGSKG